MKKFIFTLMLLCGLMLSANAAEGDYIIKYRSDMPRFYSAVESENSLGAGMYLVSEDEALALKDAGMLEICEPDRIMTYYENPNDPHYSFQYNISMIKAPYAWSLNFFGDDVLVGVVDSGLAKNHPDIDYSRVEEGYNFGAIPSDSDYNTNRYDTTDVSGHGTMVAGVIAAKRNNSEGISGIADRVKILPLKVENKLGSIYTSSVINAINAGAGYGCDILNISLGQGTPSDDLKAAIENALDLGCIVICAAGNDTAEDPGDHIRYPAGYDGVISVASVTEGYAHAETSVVNESVYISAPANSIPLLYYEGGYAYASGTSFAAPQVTAAAAIVKQLYPELTPAEFADALAATAYDLDTETAGRDNQFGYGLLDIEELIKYVSALKDNRIYVSPIDRTTYSVILHNLTDQPASVSSIICSYSGNGMTDYSHKPIASLESGASTAHYFTSETVFDKLRHFLWYSLESVKPYDRHYTPHELSVSAN